MSEFGDLLKEALTGADTIPSERNDQALHAAVEKFDRRNRTVRWMATIAVTFMTAISVWAAVALWQASPETESVKALIVYGVLFLFGMSGVGMSKMWFAMMLDHIAVMKELKRMQLSDHGR